jgi:hypothetical protein
MENGVKNVLVTIINLVINSVDAKAMVRHLWKAIELRGQHYNRGTRQRSLLRHYGNKPESRGFESQ